MTVTRTWTDPSEGGPMDRDTGQTIREQDWDAVLSNLNYLGGSNGSSGLSKYNLLTNGGFEIWQRGNGPFSAGGTYGPDRWYLQPAGTDTFSITRDTANADGGSQYCVANVFVLGTGAGGSCLLQNFNSADNLIQQLRGRTVSFSLRVKCSTPNAVRVALNNSAAPVDYSAYHTGNGQYQTLSVSQTITSASTQCFALIYFAASCTAYLDNAMLVVGSVPADYAPLHPADDLARCLRYYEVLSAGGVSFMIGGWAAAGTDVRANWVFRALKAVTPTVTKVGTWMLVNSSTQPNVAGLDANSALLTVTATATGEVNARVGSGNTVTSEANP